LKPDCQIRKNEKGACNSKEQYKSFEEVGKKSARAQPEIAKNNRTISMKHLLIFQVRLPKMS
jgi:hypothetical protein